MQEAITWGQLFEQTLIIFYFFKDKGEQKTLNSG